MLGRTGCGRGPVERDLVLRAQCCRYNHVARGRRHLIGAGAQGAGSAAVC